MVIAGLKFKLNRTQGSIKPEPAPASTEDSDSGTDDQVVVDDQPEKPAESIKKYRFSCKLICGSTQCDNL